MKVFNCAEEVHTALGQHLGFSEWLTLGKDRIESFADATGDDNWIHLDEKRAVEGPFGGTVAHGFLVLALIAKFAPQIYRIEGTRLVVNYGLNSVRFPSPVRNGDRVRASAELDDASDIGGGLQLILRYSIENDRSHKPACVAEHITQHYY